MTKKEIRARKIHAMKTLDVRKKEKADQWLKKQVIAHEQFQKAHSIGIVLSMPHEVETDSIIKCALDLHKSVYVPKTNYQHKTMDFQKLTSLNQIGVDEKGIRYVNQNSIINNHLDLVIVPGVAFSENGYRIGYGGGFFDRYLAAFKPETLSLLYDIQLCENLPIDEYDYPVSELIIATT
ncbi:5-formyltetrahydrofolate cyclo-ligase [Staphylococcus felis]|uniref:5-formyltetrahydrofolate cyclo-ligase n=1 Tax=Staphylococcus felis TaxID=46127 RepID=UPI003967AC5C